MLIQRSIKEYCPCCHRLYCDAWVDGFCWFCKADLVAARTDPNIPMRKFLHQQLVSLCQECDKWGCENGYPVRSEYPQYSELRRIGCAIYEIDGLSGIADALEVVEEKFYPDRDYLKRFVAFVWHDIGSSSQVSPASSGRKLVPESVQDPIRVPMPWVNPNDICPHCRKIVDHVPHMLEAAWMDRINHLVIHAVQQVVPSELFDLFECCEIEIRQFDVRPETWRLAAVHARGLIREDYGPLIIRMIESGEMQGLFDYDHQELGYSHFVVEKNAELAIQKMLDWLEQHYPSLMH